MQSPRDESLPPDHDLLQPYQDRQSYIPPLQPQLATPFVYPAPQPTVNLNQPSVVEQPHQESLKSTAASTTEEGQPSSCIDCYVDSCKHCGDGFYQCCVSCHGTYCCQGCCSCYKDCVETLLLIIMCILLCIFCIPCLLPARSRQ